MTPIPLGIFKTALRGGARAPAGILRKSLTAAAEGLDNRRVRFTISTETIDRDGDKVSTKGWETAAFERNPVVLWSHNASDLPIGRCVALGVENSALKAVVEFVPADMPHIGDRAEAVLRMCRTGFLSATSVGFRPLEYDIAKDRDDEDSWMPPIDFVRQELMEFSVCSIPANPEALIDPADRVMQAITDSREKASAAKRAAAAAARLRAIRATAY